MSEARWDIPETWAWATAGEIARIVGGGTPASKVDDNFSEVGIPWITPADLTGYEKSHISKGRRDLSEKGFSGSGAQVIPAGSVLFSSRAPIGYCVIASNDVTTNQGFKSLVLRGGIVPEYVRHYLIGSKDYAESKASGTTFMELSGARVAELAVPVAPLNEQRRIVAKIDGLTARTAGARAKLARVPILIARYKQRLLSLAFSGELTASWRAAHNISEAETVALKTLCSSLTDGDHQAPPRSATGIPFITISAMNTGKLELDKATRMVPRGYFEALKSSRRPAIGDVLFSVTGSIGIAALVDTDKPFVFQRHIAIAKPDARKTDGRFLSLMLASPNIKEQGNTVATGTAQLTIPLNGLREFRLPLPDLREQAEIVRRIGLAFGWLDRVSADYASAAKLLPKLDTAILAKAFRGELVPQDPNDEPASVLVQRIGDGAVDLPKSRRGRPAKTVELKGRMTIGIAGFATPATIMEVAITPPKESSMSKTRHDPDVMGQPYLAKILRKQRAAGSVETLFKAADLPVADFYKQLAWEIENHHIRDEQDKLEAA